MAGIRRDCQASGAEKNILHGSIHITTFSLPQFCPPPPLRQRALLALICIYERDCDLLEPSDEIHGGEPEDNGCGEVFVRAGGGEGERDGSDAVPIWWDLRELICG